MIETAEQADDVRDRILATPHVILDDPELMRALVAANEKALGSNVVDLRGIAMERLEARLERLEDTHRNVIAAAYENLSGTNQLHRAILRLLEPIDFDAFLVDLTGEVCEILRVDSATLVLETEGEGIDPNLVTMGDALIVRQTGFIDDYITLGRNLPVRPVTLRQVNGSYGNIHGAGSDWIRSEACIKLDFGVGRMPGLLALGAEDPHQFSPNQGTDLLQFFGGVVERAMRRWLA